MSLSSNAVIAKARAVFGDQLSAEDYAALSVKGSVADVCAYLKSIPRYSAALSDVNPQTVHRGLLEKLLRRAVFNIFEGFHRFDYTPSKEYFDFIVAELEIELILAGIQSVASGRGDEYIAALPLFITAHSHIDLPAVGQAEEFSDALDLLRGTWFYNALREPLTEAQLSGRVNINECEKRLYNTYYTRMLGTIEKKFSGKERAELKKAVLRSIDMENVVTCCRMAKFFGADGETVKQALIPFKFRLSDDAIERLAAQKDIAKIRAELAALGYRSCGEEPPSVAAEHAVTVEQLTERISLGYLQKALRLTRNASVAYFALVGCLKTELKNISTVIEGIRYGISGPEIREMLIM